MPVLQHAAVFDDVESRVYVKNKVSNTIFFNDHFPSVYEVVMYTSTRHKEHLYFSALLSVSILEEK